MEALEIAIYIGIALIAGSAIIFFLSNIDPSSISNPLRIIMGLEKREPSSMRVHSNEFHAKIYEVWNSCGFGTQNKTVVYNVYGTKELELRQIFDEYKKINLCRTIQSNTFDCGVGQTIILFHGDKPIDESDYEDFSITLPSTIIVKCNSENRKLEVTV